MQPIDGMGSLESTVIIEASFAPAAPAAAGCMPLPAAGAPAIAAGVPACAVLVLVILLALVPAAALLPPVVTVGAAWPAVLLVEAMRPALVVAPLVAIVGVAMLGFDISGELVCVLVASGAAAPPPPQARAEVRQSSVRGRRIRCAQFMKAAVVSNRPPLHDEIATQKRFHPFATGVCALFARFGAIGRYLIGALRHPALPLSTTPGRAAIHY